MVISFLTITLVFVFLKKNKVLVQKQNTVKDLRLKKSKIHLNLPCQFILIYHVNFRFLPKFKLKKDNLFYLLFFIQIYHIFS